MADVRKTVGQVALAAVTEAAIYTAPFEAGPLTLKVTNRTGQDIPVRVRVAVADAAAADKQYLCYDRRIPANSVETFNDIYVAATDVIYGWAGGAGITMQLMGPEATS